MSKEEYDRLLKARQGVFYDARVNVVGHFYKVYNNKGAIRIYVAQSDSEPELHHCICFNNCSVTASYYDGMLTPLRINSRNELMTYLMCVYAGMIIDHPSLLMAYHTWLESKVYLPPTDDIYKLIAILCTMNLRKVSIGFNIDRAIESINSNLNRMYICPRGKYNYPYVLARDILPSIEQKRSYNMKMKETVKDLLDDFAETRKYIRIERDKQTNFMG